jgi:hypothetical protein
LQRVTGVDGALHAVDAHQAGLEVVRLVELPREVKVELARVENVQLPQRLFVHFHLEKKKRKKELKSK